MRIEIEICCPECGGTNVWQEGRRLKKCAYCASLLAFEPNLENRFYLGPMVQTEEQLKEVVVTSKAEKKRAEDMAWYPGSDDKKLPEMVSVPTRPIGPYLEKYRLKVELLKKRLIYVPYWHFQGILYQCLLARNQHDAREYQLRSVEIDEAVPAYDESRWNLRDRGLRFGQATRLKEATAELLSGHPHLAFGEEADSRLDRMINAFPALVTKYDFRWYRLAGRERLPVFRPYWIVQFTCDGVENMLVDACYASVAGYPDNSEAAALLSYDERPHVSAKPPRIRVIPSRCPVCGWDTEWAADEIIHFCGNCGRALALEKKEVQSLTYHCVASPAGLCCYLPFWKLRVRLMYKNQAYLSLRDYFRESFMERLLKKGRYGDSLWIPAVHPRRIEKGDEFYSALIGDATALSPELQEGPVTPPAEICSARMSAVTACELATCILPSAAAVPASMHKLATVSRMLRETTVEVLETQLTLVPYRKQHADLLVGNQRFSTKLLE